MNKQPLHSTAYLARRLWTYVVPFWPILLIGILTNILHSGIDAGFTYMAKPFLDEGLIEQNWAFIIWIPWIMLIGISSRGVIGALAGYCMTWIARRVVNVFRQQIFGHILRLPAQYYDRSSSGKLLSKILYDVEQIAHASADALTTFVQSLFLVIGLLAVMFYINWQLSLLFIITIPFIGLIVKYTSRSIRRISHSAQQTMGEVTEIAEEAIEGYRVVRIFAGQDYETKKFNQATETSRLRDMKIALIKAYNVAGVQIIVALGMAGIIFLAIMLAEVIIITPGGFVAIIAAMLQLIKPLKDLTNVSSVIQRGLAGAESIFNLLDELAEKDKGKKILTQVKGHIQFNDINFAYQKTEGNVLKNIHFEVKPGQTVALVGRSGSGKSTLVSLFPRFYDIEEGYIRLDGIDIRDLTLNNLRHHIALVSQQIILFNDTIANNIAYGLFDQVDRATIEKAAHSAHAMAFIDDFPQGLDTIIGENGILLSGGQRQRLAIARAILKDAPVLILDEATSSLDTESERYIQSALDEVMRDRTTLVIAHRLSTIEKADKILVLSKGEIVESGVHQELLEKDGYYAKLYQMQFQNKSDFKQ